MKNKLSVMILTFIIMIVLTPVIFSKLMNSRYDKKLINLSQNGYKIKTIKENNGYLKSERVLDVVIPGSKLGNKEIEYIEAEIKTDFKNLPVTNVYFEGKIKDIKLKTPNPIIEELAKKIEFTAITPNFKTYAFSIKPLKYQELTIDTIKGNLDTQKNIITLNTNATLKNRKTVLNVKNIHLVSQREKDFFKNSGKFDINIEIGDKNATVKNVNVNTVLSMKKNAFVDTKISFKKLMFSRIINADDFYTKVKLYDLNSTLFKKSINKKDKNLTLQLLSKGFKVDVNSSLKNLTFLGFNQGGFNLNVKVAVDKAKNIQDFEQNFKKYLSLKIDADMSKEFAKMLKQSFPMIRGFLNVPADKKGIVHIRFNLAKGAIK